MKDRLNDQLNGTKMAELEPTESSRESSNDESAERGVGG